MSNLIYKEKSERLRMGILRRPVLRLGLMFVMALSPITSFAKEEKAQTLSLDKAAKAQEYFANLEVQIEDLLNKKIKDTNLIIEKKDIIDFKEYTSSQRVTKDAEIIGLKCYSIREFLRNEGVTFKKINEDDIHDLISHIKSNYSLDLKDILEMDFLAQRKVAIEKHVAPAFCFADINDKSENRVTVFISPTHLSLPGSELKLRDFGITEASLKKDREKEAAVSTLTEKEEL